MLNIEKVSSKLALKGLVFSSHQQDLSMHKSEQLQQGVFPCLIFVVVFMQKNVPIE